MLYCLPFTQLMKRWRMHNRPITIDAAFWACFSACQRDRRPVLNALRRMHSCLIRRQTISRAAPFRMEMAFPNGTYIYIHPLQPHASHHLSISPLQLRASPTHISLRPQNQRHMLTQRHHIPSLIPNLHLQIHSPFLNLLRLYPRK